MNNLPEAAPPRDYHPTLERLNALSRNHLLYFRLEVGRLLLEDFFEGDPAAYHSQDSQKKLSFAHFLESCGDYLADIGLGAQVLRQCIQAQIAVRSLPAGTVERLLFSHIVELARVEDEATRSILAQAAVENRWTGLQLRDAVLSTKAGKWIDGDPAPGLQPVAPEETEKTPQLGRVVTRFERSAEDMEALAQQWRQIAGKNLSQGQRNRLRQAVDRLKVQLSELDHALGSAPGDSEG